MKSNAPSLSARTAVSTLPCAVMTAHRRLRLVRLDPLDQAEAVAIGQAHVGQAQIERIGAQLTRGCGNRVGRGHLEIHALERDTQQLADIRLVIHDERAGLLHCVSQR